jgi:hypothetical protein
MRAQYYIELSKLTFRNRPYGQNNEKKYADSKVYQFEPTLLKDVT